MTQELEIERVQTERTFLISKEYKDSDNVRDFRIADRDNDRDFRIADDDHDDFELAQVSPYIFFMHGDLSPLDVFTQPCK